MAMINDAFATARELRRYQIRWLKRLFWAFVFGTVAGMPLGIWLWIRLTGG